MVVLRDDNENTNSSTSYDELDVIEDFIRIRTAKYKKYGRSVSGVSKNTPAESTQVPDKKCTVVLKVGRVPPRETDTSGAKTDECAGVDKNALVCVDEKTNRIFDRPANRPVKNIVQVASKIVNCDLSRPRRIRACRQPYKCTVHDAGDVVAERALYSNADYRYQGSEQDVERRDGSQIMNVLDLAGGPKPLLDAVESGATNLLYLGSTQGALHIRDAVEQTDFLHRVLYDKLQKRSTSGRMTENYTKIENNYFYCYRSKRVKISNYPQEGTAFPCVEDSYCCYPEKYRVDLRYSRLYLVTKDPPYCRFFLCCCQPKISLCGLHEITTQSLKSVNRTTSGYSVCMHNGSGYEMVDVRNLDFVVFSDSEYYWFRSNSITSFLKWVVAIQLRKQ